MQICNIRRALATTNRELFRVDAAAAFCRPATGRDSSDWSGADLRNESRKLAPFGAARSLAAANKCPLGRDPIRSASVPAASGRREIKFRLDRRPQLGRRLREPSTRFAECFPCVSLIADGPNRCPARCIQMSSRPLVARARRPRVSIILCERRLANTSLGPSAPLTPSELDSRAQFARSFALIDSGLSFARRRRRAFAFLIRASRLEPSQVDSKFALLICTLSLSLSLSPLAPGKLQQRKQVALVSLFARPDLGAVPNGRRSSELLSFALATFARVEI